MTPNAQTTKAPPALAQLPPPFKATTNPVFQDQKGCLQRLKGFFRLCAVDSGPVPALMWEIQTGFWAPFSGMAQPWLLWTFGV